MVKIIGEHGSGKTNKLIEEEAKEGGVILCANPSKTYEKILYDFDARNLRTEDYLYLFKALFNKDENIYIDDVDRMFQSFGIKGFTCDK